MLNIRQRLEIDSECVFFGASITAAGVPGAGSAQLSRPSADGQEALKLKTRLITLPRASVSCDWSFSLNGSHCQGELPKRFIHLLSPLRKKLALLAPIRPDSSCLFRSFRDRPLRPRFTFITHARIHTHMQTRVYAQHAVDIHVRRRTSKHSAPPAGVRFAPCWAGLSRRKKQSTDSPAPRSGATYIQSNLAPTGSPHTPTPLSRPSFRPQPVPWGEPLATRGRHRG